MDLATMISDAHSGHACASAMPHDRAPFVAAVTRQLGTARRYGMQPVVLVISVQAHWAADQTAMAPAEAQELMQLMCEPLQRQLRRADLLLQIAADRFGVLLADALPIAVAGICARLERPAGWPGHLLGRDLQLRLRVGASGSPAGSPHGSPGGGSAWLEAGPMVLAAEDALRGRLT
jgi:hypothetical protein